jgi:hypothetical protein
VVCFIEPYLDYSPDGLLIALLVRVVQLKKKNCSYISGNNLHQSISPKNNHTIMGAKVDPQNQSKITSSHPDLNEGPVDLQSTALTPELRELVVVTPSGRCYQQQCDAT